MLTERPTPTQDRPRELREQWRGLPAWLFRNDRRVQELTGLTPKAMANLDSKGEGPSERIRIGRQVAYSVDVLLSWVFDRLKIERGGAPSLLRREVER